jgi:hypothetical protein
MMVVSVQCVGEWDGPNVGIAVVRDDDDGGVCAVCREVRMVQLLG